MALCTLSMLQESNGKPSMEPFNIVKLIKNLYSESDNYEHLEKKSAGHDLLIL